MKPHAIDAELCHPRRDLVRIRMSREVRRKAHVHPEDPQPLFPRKKMPVFHAHEAIAPGRLVVQPTHVGDGRRGIIPRQLKRKHIRSRCGDSEREEGSNGFHLMSVAVAAECVEAVCRHRLERVAATKCRFPCQSVPPVGIRLRFFWVHGHRWTQRHPVTSRLDAQQRILNSISQS